MLSVVHACCFDLQIELNWLLDDAVAAQQSSIDVWKPCSWRHLQSVFSRAKGGVLLPNDDPKVALRLGLSHLTDLWKQRTQDRCRTPQNLATTLSKSVLSLNTKCWTLNRPRIAKMLTFSCILCQTNVQVSSTLQICTHCLMPVFVNQSFCMGKSFQSAHVSQSCWPCRVPLQYLNNCCHWRDMVLAVGPGVLIPRPETELLIDFAQQVSNTMHTRSFAAGQPLS